MTKVLYNKRHKNKFEIMLLLKCNKCLNIAYKYNRHHA